MMIIGAAFALALSAAASEPVSARTAVESATTQATVHEVVVAASADKVWEAISTAEGWRTWAAPVVWVDPTNPNVIESNYDPAAKRGDGGAIAQRVVLSVPQRIYAFRTIRAPKGFRNFDALAQVKWVFELIPEEQDRTRVRLTGSGYPRTKAGDEVVSFFRRGNAISLEFLRQRFADGPIDWKVKGKQAAAEK